VQFECKVNQIIPLELKAGEILVRWIHIDEAVLDTNGSIDHKIDLVSRLRVGIRDQIKVCLKYLNRLRLSE
jgi:hypothetical protein